jgi:hypothetical protein
MPLTVQSGVTINLDLTSTNPANLYLLPNDTYSLSSNGCNLLGGSLVAKSNFTAFTLHWTATEASTMYLLLTGPSTVIILMNHGSGQAIEQLVATTYANTETNLNVYSSTAMTNYTTSTTIPISYTYNLPPQQLQLTLVAIAFSIGAMLLLGFKKGFLMLWRFKKVEEKRLPPRCP